MTARQPIILRLEDLSKRFGDLHVLDRVSLEVRQGSRHALIGPNGAGKTTLFHLLGGAIKPDGGRILYRDRDITRWGEHERCRLGIGRTFQRSSLFDGLTAFENVALAVQQRAGKARSFLVPARRCREVNERVSFLLERVGLADLAHLPAASLSHGHRRQLEVAVALGSEPDLLLMDEPTAGMSPLDAEGFLEVIRSLPDTVTILLVEHDMDLVFGFADWISVLDAGKLIATGPPDHIRGSEAVQEAYLGSEESMEELFRPA